MEKKKTLKRLIATGVMTAFTAASLITTSYAFVTLNTEATISEFGFDIIDQEGLLLSVDGNSFFQDIDAGLIQGTILANQNKGYADQIEDYSKLRFKGVTLGGTGYSAVVNKYVTATGVNDGNVTDYFVKDGNNYVAATTYDSNETYYTTVVNASNFASYYVKDGNNYVAATSYSAAETYYSNATSAKAGKYTEEYEYSIGKFSQKIKDKRVTFVKDAITEYSAAERTAILADTTHPNYKLVKDNDRAFKHEYVAAEGRDYIFFDLWLRVAQTGTIKDNNGNEVHPSYSLKFSDRTSIKGTRQAVELYNNLTTPAALDVTGENAIRKVGAVGEKRADGTEIAAGKFVAGDYIYVNPADAMRLGVTVLDGNTITNQTISKDAAYYVAIDENDVDDTNYQNYYINNGTDFVKATAYDANETYYAFTNTASDIDLKVYEPSVGLGSYAIDGRTEDAYKPTLNAMYTYNNSLFPLSPYIKGVEDNGQLGTDDTFTNDVLATFDWNSSTNEYNVVKMSVMLWLEGWDADYFVGLRNTAVSVKLGFEIEEQ